jgi:hypothetical protein
MAADFVSPIVQGLTVLRQHEERQKQVEQQKQEQANQDLQSILIAKLLERGL